MNPTPTTPRPSSPDAGEALRKEPVDSDTERAVQQLRANIEHDAENGISGEGNYLWCCDQTRTPCGGAVTLLARLTEVEVRAKAAETALRELAGVGDRLIAEYKQEEVADGFPFNFALRAAHRDLIDALSRTTSTEGERDE